jgi:hypothetical protein
MTAGDDIARLGPSKEVMNLKLALTGGLFSA